MRMIAGIFLALAGLFLVVDLAPLAGGTAWSEIRFTAFGEVWFRIHPESQQMIEPAISRHVSPMLWDYVVLPLMTAPAAAVAFGLSVVFWLLRRRRDRDGATRGVRRR